MNKMKKNRMKRKTQALKNRAQYLKRRHIGMLVRKGYR